MHQESNWTDITQAICSILLLVTTLIGFIYISAQLKSAKKTNQITTYDNLYSRMHDIHKFFIENGNKNLRQYFYESKTIKVGDIDYDRAIIVAEMFADFFQQIKLQSDLMPNTTSQGWLNYAKSIIASSPILKKYLETHASWYPSNFYLNS